MMVINNSASHNTILVVVIGTAVLQVVIHLIYFLNINTSLADRWNIVTLLFTAIIIGIIVIGSLWIIYNLNLNMLVT